MKSKFFTLVTMLCLLSFATLSACENKEPAVEKEPAQESSNIEGWYFRAIYGYPVSVTFEPIVLFKDGDYVEIEDQPLEDIDEEQDKQERPKAWGTWKKEGDTYYLTNHKGNVADYRLGTGSWFPAYPYMEEVPLANAYENTTGGDYGNGTSALFKTRIDFPRDGYFYHSTDGGIITPGSAGWNKSADAGSYSIKDHTIVLRYNGGKEVRLSFALGAKGDPAGPSSDMVFIGGDVFLAEKE